MINRKTFIDKQNGIAVITAVFILAILTILATILIAQQRIDIYRTRQMLNAEQSYAYIGGVIDWAKQVLIEDLNAAQEEPGNNVVWLKTLPVTSVQGGTIQGTLEDYQGRININNLIYNKDRKALLNLMTTLKIGDNPQDLINSIVSWIKPPDANAANESTQTYLAKKPPYRAAGRPMIAISELRLVNGIDAKIYNQLSPYLAALPIGTQTNISHAKNVVQLAYGVDTVDNQKNQNTNNNNNDDNNNTADNNNNNNQQISEKSEYFLLTSIVSMQNQNLVVYTLLERVTDKQQPRISVVWKSVGAM